MLFLCCFLLCFLVFFTSLSVLPMIAVVMLVCSRIQRPFCVSLKAFGYKSPCQLNAAVVNVSCYTQIMNITARVSFFQTSLCPVNTLLMTVSSSETISDATPNTFSCCCFPHGFQNGTQELEWCLTMEKSLLQALGAALCRRMRDRSGQMNQLLMFLGHS